MLPSLPSILFSQTSRWAVLQCPEKSRQATIEAAGHASEQTSEQLPLIRHPVDSDERACAAYVTGGASEVDLGQIRRGV